MTKLIDTLASVHGASPGRDTAVTQTANLFRLDDLEDVSKTTELAESDRNALHAVADWIKTFVARPHKDLGRTGPVCPFVPVALERKTPWLAPERIVGRKGFPRAFKGVNAMTLIKTLAVVAAGTVLTTNALAQSAMDVRGASPYVAIENEPAPKLIVDPPLPEGLVQGVFWAQYRVENVHIAPVFGAGALQASPRIGHLHVTVDDQTWWWADASDNNTIDIAGLKPGKHQVTISLVDANHNVFPGQVVRVPFTVPEPSN